jgi:Ankyrin repeats (3 copies)
LRLPPVLLAYDLLAGSFDKFNRSDRDSRRTGEWTVDGGNLVRLIDELLKCGDVRRGKKSYIRTRSTRAESEFRQSKRVRSWALMGRTHDKLLLGAAQRGNLGRIERLLADGANVNARGKYGHTPLVNASYSGHADAVRLLLDAGATPSLRTDDGGTPLYWAASEGHADVVKLLLDRGAEVDAIRASDWTPLTAAIYNGHESVAERLLVAGARGDHESHGENMYQWAVKHGRERIAQSLQRRGWHGSG